VVHCDQSVSTVKLQFHQLQSLPVAVEAVKAVDLEEAQIVVLLSAPAPASYLINWPLLDLLFDQSDRY
jgi:hypothetical protein